MREYFGRTIYVTVRTESVNPTKTNQRYGVKINNIIEVPIIGSTRLSS